MVLLLGKEKENDNLFNTRRVLPNGQIVEVPLLDTLDDHERGILMPRKCDKIRTEGLLGIDDGDKLD